MRGDLKANMEGDGEEGLIVFSFCTFLFATHFYLVFSYCTDLLSGAK